MRFKIELFETHEFGGFIRIYFVSTAYFVSGLLAKLTITVFSTDIATYNVYIKIVGFT